MVSTAKAEEVSRSDIVITSGSGGFTTTLKLALSKPITATQRRQVIKDLKSGAADGQVSPMAMIRIDCNQTFARTTNEGTWETDYKCFPTYATLPWGFRISKSVRGIIVGLVKEHGLKWWRNNVSQPKNAPHLEAKDYIFHGTMKKVWNGDTVAYKDLYTFRHNVNGGGDGSISTGGTFGVGP
ncbi:MAG: hypothetical protein QM619_01935 [Micropruina sp.]|uniref:hypothetical protein n=1 Tax=Micropruina sp. TaxID=2737536 RepID=UPI0039E4328E